MSTVSLVLDDDLAGLLADGPEPVDRAGLELIVMELHRRGKISGGRGSEILGITGSEFIRRASALGIPYLSTTDDDLNREILVGRSL